MSDKRTYYIKKEDCIDVGWAYEIESKHYYGNLVIENLGKPIVFKGNQIVEGNQIVKGKAIVGQCKYTIYYYKDKIRIGCKEKTTVEWEEFFNSNEEYETSRDSLEFKQIYKAFLMAKVAQENDGSLS